jgi:cytochrome b561
MTKRTIVKWLHWLAFFLILYFFFAEPEVEDGPLLQRSDELSTHAGMGMVLAVVAAVWFLIYLAGGALGRPGPKLGDRARKAHRWLNTGLYWLLPATVLSGALAGLASEYPVLGFGIVPLNPAGWGTEGLHGAMEEVHEIVFNLTTLVIILHAAFHIWRHYWLKDNGLRIMAPRALHKYL